LVVKIKKVKIEVYKHNCDGLIRTIDEKRIVQKARS